MLGSSFEKLFGFTVAFCNDVTPAFSALDERVFAKVPS